MEAVSTWLCSFRADEAKVCQLEQTITCGEEVLLCSIGLTNPKSTFTNYHENKIAVSYCDKNTEAGGSTKYECYIVEVNSRLLDVYFTAYRAGEVKVKVDLGKWYLFKGEHLI